MSGKTNETMNTAVELTDAELEQASGGSVYLQICGKCGTPYTYFEEEDTPCPKCNIPPKSKSWSRFCFKCGNIWTYNNIENNPCPKCGYQP